MLLSTIISELSGYGYVLCTSQEFVKYKHSVEYSICKQEVTVKLTIHF
jgi:hypothetical protein